MNKPLGHDRWRERMLVAGAYVPRSDPYLDPDEGERM